MYKTKLLTILGILLAVSLVASIAAMPAAPAQPNQPTVNSTANGGELSVTWGMAAGSQFYTIGWTNLEEYQDYQKAGREWLDAFHFVTIPARYTSHTIKDLEPSGSYYVIIGARTSRLGGDAPTWSEWSNLVTTAGDHGEGFCPITGLPLPAEGYLSVGDKATSGPHDLQLNRVDFPETSTVGSGPFLGEPPQYFPPSGRIWVRTCVTHWNKTDSAVVLAAGYDHIVASDAGVGFVASQPSLPFVGLFETNPNSDRSYCQLWHVPEDAKTVITAVVLDLSNSDSYHLFKTDVN